MSRSTEDLHVPNRINAARNLSILCTQIKASATKVADGLATQELPI